MLNRSLIAQALVWMALVAGLLHGCATTPQNRDADRVMPHGEPADLEIYGTSNLKDDRHARRMIAPDGSELFLAASPIVTGDDVEHALRTADVNGNDAILLVLERKAADRMKQATQQYMHRRFAFVWQGRVISAPRIMGVLSKRLMILQHDDEESRAAYDAILRVLGD